MAAEPDAPNDWAPPSGAPSPHGEAPASPTPSADAPPPVRLSAPSRMLIGLGVLVVAIMVGVAVSVLAAIVPAFTQPAATRAYGAYDSDGYPLPSRVHPTTHDLVTFLTMTERLDHHRSVDIDCVPAVLRPSTAMACRGTTSTGGLRDYYVTVDADYAVTFHSDVSFSSVPGLDAGVTGIGTPGEGFPDASPDGFDPDRDPGRHLPVAVTVGTDEFGADGRPLPGATPSWTDAGRFALANAQAAGYRWVAPSVITSGNLPEDFSGTEDGTFAVWDAAGDRREVTFAWSSGGPLSVGIIEP